MESESSPVVSVYEYIAILRRRRAIILQCFVLISVVGLVITLMTKPVYEASAELLVDGPSLSMNTVDSSNPMSALLALNQQQTVATQVEVLQTRSLTDQVTQQVGQSVLSVAALPDTNVIVVDSQAQDPKVAAAAANTLLDLYISQNTDSDVSELAQAYEFVRTQGARAHSSLLSAEAALEQFEKQNHVTDLSDDRSAQVARVDALTDRLHQSQVDLDALSAQISEDQKLMAAQPQTIMVQLKATNPLIASINAQISDLETRMNGMVQPGGFTTKAPEVKALQGNIDELKKQLAEQPALITTQASSPNSVRENLREQIVSLQSQASSQRAQMQSQRAILAQANANLAHYPDWAVQVARLTRERDTAAASDKMFAEQLADLSLREQAHHESAHIIQRAGVPTSPIKPKKAAQILLGCLIGLLMGIGLGFLQELLDDRINSVEDADRVLGLPSLGRVPMLTEADAFLLPQMKGLDPAAESYRILRTNIMFASIDNPLHTLLVTSSSPGEGKTTTAMNLAFAMIMDGKKVILVDTDLRRPSLHKYLRLPTVPGLTDVLLGNANLNDVLLDHDQMAGLSVLTAGSTPPNPGELLGSRSFRNLVTELTQRADLVIFDSPPVLAAADSQILASQLDGAVIVIETGETKKAEAKQCLALLRHARANVLGIAYNKARTLSDLGYYYHYSTPALTETPVGSRRLPSVEDAE